MSNIDLKSAMVIVIENGFPTCVKFMEDIQLKGIQNELSGWWWSSDKGLIDDPSQSDEFVIKAQHIYDALQGKAVYVNGVRLYGNYTHSQIQELLAVNNVNILESPNNEKPPKVEGPGLVVEYDDRDLPSTVVGTPSAGNGILIICVIIIALGILKFFNVI